MFSLFQEYGDIQEVCTLELSSFHYKLPVVEEQVLELVPVLYPEPEEECLEVETAEDIHLNNSISMHT